MNAKEKVEAIEKLLEEIKLTQRIDKKQLEQFHWTNEQRAALEAMVQMRGVYIEKLEAIVNHVKPRVSVRGKPTVWNGQSYPSIGAAARANGMKQAALYWRLLRGYTGDSDVPARGFQNVEIEWEGERFSSVSEAAQHYGISQAAMSKRLKQRLKKDGIDFQGNKV